MVIREHIHLIGIGGVSMSAIAQILINNGIKVSGSDTTMSAGIRQLMNLGADVSLSHDAKNIQGATLVVYTAAIAQANVELVAARSNGIPCVERAVFLGQLMSEYSVPIAVSGTHGKTTTTSMLACILLKANMDPTIMVGGNLKEINGNLHIGSKKCLVFEACEYVDSFLSFNPKIAIVLNLEPDHLDYFRDVEHIKSSFRKFMGKVPVDGFCVINEKEPNVMDAAKGITQRIVSYGTEQSDYYAANIDFNTFDIFCRGEKLGRIRLNVKGLHNISNSVAAFATAHTMGIELNAIIQGLEWFSGTERRFEYKGKLKDADIYDDYAHHPTEIEASLKTALSMPHNRVWCVFQPHTYTRTRALEKEFILALSKADRLIMAPIYAARENPIEGVTSEKIAKNVENAIYFEDMEKIADHVRDNIQDGDLVITMGAGDIWKVGEMLLGKKLA